MNKAGSDWPYFHFEGRPEPPPLKLPFPPWTADMVRHTGALASQYGIPL